MFSVLAMAAQPASYTGELPAVSPYPAKLGLSGALPARPPRRQRCLTYIAGFFIAWAAARLIEARAERLTGSLASCLRRCRRAA